MCMWDVLGFKLEQSRRVSRGLREYTVLRLWLTVSHIHIKAGFLSDNSILFGGEIDNLFTSTGVLIIPITTLIVTIICL